MIVVLLLAVLGIGMTDAQAEDLLKIYELALGSDPKLKEAEANRNAILENLPQSVARLLPVVTVNGQIRRNSVLNKFNEYQLGFIAGGRNLGFWSSAASIDLIQPIYRHEYWVQLAQADHQIAEAEATLAGEQQHLILRTAQAYFNVLLAQDTLDFNNAEQRATHRQLEQAQARFEVGMVASTDVHEARAGYDLARANTIEAEQDLENARELLGEIVGEYSGELSALLAEIPLDAPRPDNADTWSNQAQQENPTIIAAINSAEIAKKNVDLKFAGHLPSIDLVGSAGFTDSNRPFRISTEYQTIGMEINVPLFTGGSVTSQVRQARYQYEAALERLDSRRRSVRRQGKDAFRGIHTAISQVKALEAALVSAQSSLEATEAGFEVGTRTMVEILAVQRSLFRTMRDYAKARYNYIIQNLNLKQAAGVLREEDLALVNGWLGAKQRSKSGGNLEEKEPSGSDP